MKFDINKFKKEMKAYTADKSVTLKDLKKFCDSRVPSEMQWITEETMNWYRNINCPRCGHKQSCPCKACQESHPTEKPWVWKDDQIHCAECDLTTDWLKVEAEWIEFLRK